MVGSITEVMHLQHYFGNHGSGRKRYSCTDHDLGWDRVLIPRIEGLPVTKTQRPLPLLAHLLLSWLSKCEHSVGPEKEDHQGCLILGISFTVQRVNPGICNISYLEVPETICLSWKQL